MKLNSPKKRRNVMNSAKSALLHGGKARTIMNCITLLIFIFTSFTGYGQKQQLQKPGSESVLFPIMAWYGLTPAQLDIAHFRELADAGFTINFSNWGTYELTKKALDL